MSYLSRKYQIFFDTKNKNLEEKYLEANFEIEAIHSGKASLMGEAKAPDSLVVYYFMKTITAKIEILDENRNSQIFHFPKPPCCFYLSPKTVNWFQKHYNIDSTESKLLDVFDNFNGFYEEMKSFEVIISNFPKIGHILTGKTFKIAKIICWILGFAINVIHLEFNRYRDYQVYQDSRYANFAVYTLSFLIVVISLSLTLLWFLTSYQMVLNNEIAKFKRKNPFSNPYSVYNFVKISFFLSFLA